jgi:hypothetical protein
VVWDTISSKSSRWVANGLQHHVLINGVYCSKFVLKQNLVVSNEKILNHTMEETTKKNILILV